MTDLDLFRKKRILLMAEDRAFARDMANDLTLLGATVLGPVATTADATAVASSARGPDGAILDIDIGEESTFPVADLLLRFEVPFVFAAAFAPDRVPRGFPGYVFCGIPVALSQIAKALFGKEDIRSH
ncbi:MAG: response regulator [Rhizobiaceae bacterium]|nr:response regulator [Rhizobiaceae bacterium]MCV0407466.1 response regulator [Rhizobiaceae bacterium]